MKNINIFCFGFGQVAKNFLKKLNIEQYNINLSATSRSESSKKILDNFEVELKNFKQICPIEMLDKLDNPITLKSNIKKVS